MENDFFCVIIHVGERMKYKLNDIVTVSITSIVSYGVFVKVDEEYTGLIHISEVNGSYINDIENYFKSNKEIKARIIGIDEKNKHISLSTKKIKESTRKNKLKEVGSGFNELKENLPKWIDETKKELENSK